MKIWKHALGSLDLSKRAAVMGIVNVTPDSFSDGGECYGVKAAVERAIGMLADGADILDIGGESTRPGADPVDAEEETRRVLPVVEELRKRAPRCVISVDTSKAQVAEACLRHGAAIINDVSALRTDPLMAKTVRAHGAGLVLMHRQGEPRTMQRDPKYTNVVAEVLGFFRERLAFAAEAGIERQCLAVDPGIGFGKKLEHNLTLCQNMAVLADEIPDRPVVLGVSRKSFLAAAAGCVSADPAERDPATLAVNLLAIERGARIVRVHAVRAHAEAIRAAQAVFGGDFARER